MPNRRSVPRDHANPRRAARRHSIGRYVLAGLCALGNAFNGHVPLAAVTGDVIPPLPEDEHAPGDPTPECAPLTVVERRAWAHLTADLV